MSISIKDMSVDEIAQLGIDLTMISICDKIRQLASLDRFSVSMPCTGLNRHLIAYIEYCVVSFAEFAKAYLVNLQPYMIIGKYEGEKGY